MYNLDYPALFKKYRITRQYIIFFSVYVSAEEGDKNIKAIRGYVALLIIFDKTFIFKLKLIVLVMKMFPFKALLR